MYFSDRKEAGRQLGRILAKYKKEKPVVLALPRGGIIVAIEVAKRLHAPLSLIITRKISHPVQPEYALAAVSEKGKLVTSKEGEQFAALGWFQEQVKKELEEAKRRRRVYLRGRKDVSLKRKTIMLVDDGIATGLTMKAAIAEVRRFSPQKIILAVPVAPAGILEEFSSLVDVIVCLLVPEKGKFLGSIGEYYDSFPQLSDNDVIRSLQLLKQ